MLSAAGADVYTINSSGLVPADIELWPIAWLRQFNKWRLMSCYCHLTGGKELAGSLAQAIGAGCITDVLDLQGKDGRIECRRNALGGAAIATQYIESDRQVIAIAPRPFLLLLAREAVLRTPGISKTFQHQSPGSKGKGQGQRQH